MKYVKPVLEEIELELEGTFLDSSTKEVTVNPTPVAPPTGEGEEPDSPWN